MLIVKKSPIPIYSQKPWRLTFWVQFLLILSCIAAFVTVDAAKPPAKAPVKPTAKAKAKPPPADEEAAAEGGGEAAAAGEMTLETAKTWSDVFSIPSEGYDIIGKLKPPPCPNLFVPPVLIPAVDMAGCITVSALKRICPSHGDGANIVGMGYTRGHGVNNSDEASNSWMLLSTKYHNGMNWIGFYKFCSIEVTGEPYIGVLLSAGMWQGGEFNIGQWAAHGIFFAKTC